MKLITVNIQGNIFTSEILEKIRQDDIRYQSPKDFNLKLSEQVRDEINNAWSLLNTHWQIFKQKRTGLSIAETGTSETRKYWMLPLLGILGYEMQASTAEIVNNKSYAISHRANNKDGFPIHIVGSEMSMDKKAESGVRLSPHALVQEYVNSTDHIYGFVSNGSHFRVLRDATRLSRLSYLEFNLEQMMEEGHYAEFALFYRLLHASRINDKKENIADSIIEFYHNEALSSGSRIRERLSLAVEQSIATLANGILTQPENEILREKFENGKLSPKEFYLYILRSVYRILFLLVIEERNLIYRQNLSESEKKLKDIYYRFYSVQRLTHLVSRSVYIEPRKIDLWQSLLTTFRLFEDNNYSKKLGINALGSGIFSPNAIGSISDSTLNNQTVLEVFRYLVTFENENRQLVRVNYADLDVEEFGSVYEGLLEFEPVVEDGAFRFKQGGERSSSGSHYTPEELVKPLINHSVDHIIADKLTAKDREAALLGISICDVSCGSGHILLSAARRIGFELAKARSNEEQPTPPVLRTAIRDVIKQCIYGVDLNPLAVELCKVALWLEAHDPGQPLNFLDHHIKNGNAIVGLAHYEELQNGIASEAFKTLPGDEKTIAAAFKKRNDDERKKQMAELFDVNTTDNDLVDLQSGFIQFNKLPEQTPEQIAAKAEAYGKLTNGKKWFHIKQLADLQTAQFFIPKTTDNKETLTTQSKYNTYLHSGSQIQDRGRCMAVSHQHFFFHWFLEFPEVFQKGGFDCVLGNPPFLGGQKLSGAYGNRFLEYIKYTYKPIGAVDLVTYFFRRIFTLIKPGGFQSLISTNTIAQGSAREGGLDIICSAGGGIINHAVRSMRWPGQAAVEVSLVTIYKGDGWNKPIILDSKKVDRITPYLDDSEVMGNPYPLKANAGKSFQGSIVLGKGFVLEPEEAAALIAKDPRNKEVLFPYLNGDDLNNDPEQKPSRWVINFFDWSEEEARRYPDCFEIVERLVKPERMKQNDKGGKEKWWQFLRPRNELYRTISQLDQVMVVPLVSKYSAVDFAPTSIVYMHKLGVIVLNDFSSFAILSSSLHNIWCWKNSSTLGAGTLNYSTTDCFENYPFPAHQSLNDLINIGKHYYDLRSIIMVNAQIGLTKLYNLFHNKEYCGELSSLVEKLRNVQIQMDTAILKAYEWIDISLKHDFYELDYLPEKDRMRFTIHPDSRKEILSRLLKLNHTKHEDEKNIMYTKI